MQEDSSTGFTNRTMCIIGCPTISHKGKGASPTAKGKLLESSRASFDIIPLVASSDYEQIVGAREKREKDPQVNQGLILLPLESQRARILCPLQQSRPSSEQKMEGHGNFTPVF